VQYFGRLKRNPRSPGPVRTREIEPQAEKRMVAHAETTRRRRLGTIRSPTPQGRARARRSRVAAERTYRPALQVARARPEDRDRRLRGQNGAKWEGYFGLNATASPGNDPTKVEQALYKEIEKLQTTKVEPRELQKVKNRFAADDFRGCRTTSS